MKARMRRKSEIQMRAKQKVDQNTLPKIQKRQQYQNLLESLLMVNISFSGEKLDVINCYQNYVQLNYVTSPIVFDGYESMSIKVNGHARRMTGQEQLPNVFVREKGTAHFTKK